jgi:2-oxoacid:acceptor oxidoreductase delta subunit (pyruvate/2-ketoisovalerate family)
MIEKQAGLKTWREVARGGAIMEAGSSQEVNTGTWRTFVPVRDMQKCIHCLRCWIMCPDSAILARDGKIVGTDLMHCKGCGICAAECPVDAIDMKLEAEMKEGEPKG